MPFSLRSTTATFVYLTHFAVVSNFETALWEGSLAHDKGYYHSGFGAGGSAQGRASGPNRARHLAPVDT